MLRTALCCMLIAAIVPATLMGSTTYFFINENPDYDDELSQGGEDPVWQAEIIEIESDSVVTPPDGY